ncbi:hypothetical protein BDZ91DRAFT_745528 [Kalaharituber pfeilii]|nr:hypothetical protein BDZ91DRAFT_745528 [Kalaharituber pfeilii]
MENIVDNLQSKDGLTYADVRTRLLDLPNSSSSSGDALVAAKKKDNKKKKPRKENQQSSSTSSASSSPRKGQCPSDECSYCWKRNLSSKGHTHTSCTVLKEAKEKKNTASSSGSANLAVEVSEVATGACFLTFADDSAPPEILPSPPLGSALKSAQDKTYEIQAHPKWV